MKRIQQKLCNHTIIAGFGRNGSTAAEELVAAGLDPANLVVIDCAENACVEARALGAAVMQGDASSNAILRAAHIERAATMIVSAGRDDSSILIVLTAHALAPRLPIAVTISSADNEDIATNAGAAQVINPIRVTGQLLARAARPAAGA